MSKQSPARNESGLPLGSPAQDILDHAPIGVFKTTPEGRFLYANQTLADMYGYAAPQDLVASVQDIAAKLFADPKEVPAVTSLLATEGIIKNYECEHIRKDGTRFWASGSIRTVYAEDGSVSHYQGFVTDITQRNRAEKRLEDEFSLRNALLDNIPNCVALILKKDTREIVASNRAGHEIGAVPGKTCFQTCALRDDPCPFCRANELWKSGQLQQIEVEYRGSWYEGIWAPLSDDLYVHFLFDITARKQVEQALKESEARFRTLFNESPVSIIIHDKITGLIVDANDVAYRTYGLSSLQELQTNDFWTDPPYSADAALRWVNKAASEGVQQFEWKNKKINEEAFWEYVTLRSVVIAGTERILSVAIDITERKMAEDALRDERLRLDNIIMGTNIGTWEWNIQAGETVCNERWAEIIGYTLEELTPISIETWAKHTHPDDLKVSMDLLERHFSGDLDYYECETRMKHKSGGWIWVLDKGRVFTWTEDGKPLWMFGTHLDITERKRAEKEIKDINELLQKANADKDKLFSIIAHDLKSPMCGLVISTEMLANEPELFSEKDIRTLSTELHKNAKNTFALLEDLLQWARMSQGGIDFAPEASGLNELVDIVLSTAQDMAKAKEIPIRLDLPQGMRVLVDPPMVKTVIRNILFNAIKFTHRGGEIVIKARQEGQTVTVAIQDNGIGMNEQIMSTAFFLEKDKRQLGTEGEKGTGLGLVLCKQFIEQHGGQIWAESEPDKGTTVFFTLSAV